MWQPGLTMPMPRLRAGDLGGMCEGRPGMKVLHRSVLRNVKAGEQSQPSIFRQLQSLLDSTFLRRRSCDRKGPMPGRLKLSEAFVSSRIWEKYLRDRDSIATENPLGCPALEPSVRTQGFVDLETGPQVNECHLFHGTSMEAAGEIFQSGFRLDFAGQSTQQRFGAKRKCMFANGIYFSECSSKADEYSKEGAVSAVSVRSVSSVKGLRLFPMLLCRVVLGRVLRVQRAVCADDPHALSKKLKHQRCNSLVGDLEVQCGTYWEFVLPRVEGICPEYLLLYRRLYGPPSPSAGRRRPFRQV